MKKTIQTVINAAASPAEKTTKVLVKEQLQKKHIMLTLGTIAVFAGAFMASIAQSYCPSWCPHFVWDGTAYSIHGLGIAPIVKVLFNI